MKSRFRSLELEKEYIWIFLLNLILNIISALPRGGPHIQGVQQDVRIGDFINLNCTSLKSKPAANLTFFINNRNVSFIISAKVSYCFMK